MLVPLHNEVPPLRCCSYCEFICRGNSMPVENVRYYWLRRVWLYIHFHIPYNTIALNIQNTLIHKTVRIMILYWWKENSLYRCIYLYACVQYRWMNTRAHHLFVHERFSLYFHENFVNAIFKKIQFKFLFAHNAKVLTK